jgi:regulator of sirC expression with transglutaminase-like and TPR domain
LAPVASAAELTERSQKEAKKALGRFTRDELERQRMATPEGRAAWDENARTSEAAYRRALTLDPAFAPAHRGLAMLFEKCDRGPEAVEQYRQYLELAPNAPDSARVRARISKIRPGTSD